MTRRLVLAWSAGATCGYVVGWLAGSAVRDQRDFRVLRRPVRRPEPRTAPRTGVESREAGNGAQTGAQRLRWADLFGIDPDYTDGLPVDVWLDRNRRDADPIPAQRLYPLEEVAAEFGVDMEDDCPVTLGPLRCPFTGPHSNHAFQSDTWAPDRKDDTDEGIE